MYYARRKNPVILNELPVLSLTGIQEKKIKCEIKYRIGCAKREC